MLGESARALEYIGSAMLQPVRYGGRFWPVKHEAHRDIDFEGLRDTPEFREFMEPVTAPRSPDGEP